MLIFLMTAKDTNLTVSLLSTSLHDIFVIVILTALRKFFGYVIAVGLNITKNLNVQANNNLYIDLRRINIAL